MTCGRLRRIGESIERQLRDRRFVPAVRDGPPVEQRRELAAQRIDARFLFDSARHGHHDSRFSASLQARGGIGKKSRSIWQVLRESAGTTILSTRSRAAGIGKVGVAGAGTFGGNSMTDEESLVHHRRRSRDGPGIRQGRPGGWRRTRRHGPRHGSPFEGAGSVGRSADGQAGRDAPEPTLTRR